MQLVAAAHAGLCKAGTILTVGVFVQGVIGETYSRMLAGQAVQDPEHPLYLPEDFKFHGQEEEYTVDGYFGEHRCSLGSAHSG